MVKSSTLHILKDQLNCRFVCTQWPSVTSPTCFVVTVDRVVAVDRVIAVDRVVAVDRVLICC